MLDIPGYENLYKINSDGDIFSRKGKLKPSPNTNGYPTVSLFNKEKKRKTWQVHRLVALVFIANPDNLPQINHIDGIKANSKVENLEWCTATQNMAHAWRTGLINAHATKVAKLQAIEVHEIYILCENRINQKIIAQIYVVSLHTIKAIRSGKVWKHLKLKETYESRTKEENHIQADKLLRKGLERIQSTRREVRG